MTPSLLRGALLLALLAAVAPASAQPSAPGLVLVESTKIRDKDAEFDEPSGLALSADRTFLWSVSDDAGEVFRLGFDGRLLPGPRLPLPWPDQAEGVAATPDGARLIVARETGAELAVIDIATGAARLAPLSAMTGWDAVRADFGEAADKNGLEGVAVDPSDGTVLVLREAEPRLLIAISPTLDRILGVRLLDAAAGFDDALGAKGRLDVSGLAFGPGRGQVWIVSDRARRVFVLDLAGGPAVSVPLLRAKGEPLDNAEGVAWDPARRRLFVVSDDKGDSRLVTYEVTQAR